MGKTQKERLASIETDMKHISSTVNTIERYARRDHDSIITLQAEFNGLQKEFNNHLEHWNKDLQHLKGYLYPSKKKLAGMGVGGILLLAILEFIKNNLLSLI